jgi:tetratricopeptide (TPR) repeat protein
MKFRPTDGPAELLARFDALLAEDDVSAAAELIGGYLDAGGARTYATLVAWAWALWESAITVHVDHVEERSAQALALLAEAGPLHLVQERTLAASIEHIHRIAIDENARVDQSAIQPDAELTIDEAVALAHRLADTGRDPARAARLFLRCDHEIGNPPQFYLVNAGSCLFDAGRYDDAEILLRQVVSDPHPALLAEADFQVVTAWTTLIRTAFARGNPIEVRSVWREAVEATRTLNSSFPLAGSRPAMIAILHDADRLGLDEIAAPVAALAKARLKPTDIDPATAVLIARNTLPEPQ